MPSATSTLRLILPGVIIKHPMPIILNLPSAIGTPSLIPPGVIIKHSAPILFSEPDSAWCYNKALWAYYT